MHHTAIALLPENLNIIADKIGLTPEAAQELYSISLESEDPHFVIFRRRYCEETRPDMFYRLVREDYLQAYFRYDSEAIKREIINVRFVSVPKLHYTCW